MSQLSSDFIRNSAKIFTSSSINNLVFFAISIFAAKTLSLEDFGEIGLSLSLIVLIPFVLDFGINASIVKHSQRPLSGISVSIQDLSKAVLMVKLFLCVCIFILSILINYNRSLFPYIDSFSQSFLFLSLLSGGLLSIWNFIRSYDQAKSNFRKIQNMTLYYAIIRAVSAYILFSFLGINFSTVVSAIYVIPLAFLILPTIFDRRLDFYIFSLTSESSRSEWTNAIKYLWNYSKWIGISSLIFVVISRLPQFVLEWKGMRSEVGFFSAALTFISVFSLINDSVKVIVLPKVSAISDGAGRQNYKNKLTSSLPLYIFLMLLLTGILTSVAYSVLGKDHYPSIVVLLILSCSTAITVYIGMFNVLIHSLEKPHYDALINIARLCLLFVILMIIPPNSIYYAAALAVTMILGEFTLFLKIKSQ